MSNDPATSFLVGFSTFPSRFPNLSSIFALDIKWHSRGDATYTESPESQLYIRLESIHESGQSTCRRPFDHYVRSVLDSDYLVLGAYDSWDPEEKPAVAAFRISVGAMLDVCAAIPKDSVFYKRLLFRLFLAGTDTCSPHQMDYANWCVGEIKQFTGFEHLAMTEMLTKVWEERQTNPHGWSEIPWIEFTFRSFLTMTAQEKNQLELEKASMLANIPHCEQYERMISGMLYDSLIPKLTNARLNARKHMNEYNTWFPEGGDLNIENITKTRVEMLKSFLGHIADDEVFIEPPLRVDYGTNMSVGKRFYANFNLTVLDSAIVSIGDRVMIGPNVIISTATHETEVGSRRANIEYACPITIGDDCWIGGGVIVLPGVTIGDGCTIGAGSIVTRDIPAWSVAVGSPARIIRKVKALDKPED
ncbi:hypothetical protein FGRMN_6454 [Fusarium graminum]|nr:hypothetical protein FGRMN_6454 [Fusarium graminum]